MVKSQMMSANKIEVKVGGEYSRFFHSPIWLREDITQNLISATTVEFERYGGLGMGRHGGGARSVNINKYQVKGVGLTPLAGVTENPNYAHGTLTLTEAMLELIYTNIFQNILPVGVAKCYGIYYTGTNTSFEFAPMLDDVMIKASSLKKTHGAVLVRELCERPGHYLRAGGFSPKKEYEDIVCSDTERIRRALRAYAKRFSSYGDFIAYIGGFLSNCANQFSFSKVAGIFHGGITPSNIVVDGRWLDLSSSTFIGLGRNFIAANYSFQEEPNQVIATMLEWMYTFGKYTGVEFNPSPLADYYYEQFGDYYRHHFPYALGMERVFESSEKSIFGVSIDKISDMVFSDSRLCGYDELSRYDNFPIFIYWCKVLSFDRFNDTNDNCSILDFRKLKSAYGNRVFQVIIKSIKRTTLSRMYQRNILIDNIDDIVSRGDIKELSLLIDRYSNESWVFCDEYNTKETLWKTSEYLIYFDVENQSIFIERCSDLGNPKLFVVETERLNRFCNVSEINLFKSYIDQIFELLRSFERKVKYYEN